MMINVVFAFNADSKTGCQTSQLKKILQTCSSHWRVTIPTDCRNCRLLKWIMCSVVRVTSRPKFSMYFSGLIPATHPEQRRFLCNISTISLHDLYKLLSLSLWTAVLSPTLYLLGSSVLFNGLFSNALSLCFQLTVKEQITEPHN
jgi:hypothetical protein